MSQMLTVEGPITESLVLADGVRLDADIYRPGTGGPYPVLLLRQP
jgi:predicted acyl esterase